MQHIPRRQRPRPPLKRHRLGHPVDRHLVRLRLHPPAHAIRRLVQHDLGPGDVVPPREVVRRREPRQPGADDGDGGLLRRRVDLPPRDQGSQVRGAAVRPAANWVVAGMLRPPVVAVSRETASRRGLGEEGRRTAWEEAASAWRPSTHRLQVAGGGAQRLCIGIGEQCLEWKQQLRELYVDVGASAYLAYSGIRLPGTSSQGLSVIHQSTSLQTQKSPYGTKLNIVCPNQPSTKRHQAFLLSF